MRYRIIIEPDQDYMFVAKCPALPGCIGQGATRAEAIANIKDAIQGYLLSFLQHAEPIPAYICQETVEVEAFSPSLDNMAA